MISTCKTKRHYLIGVHPYKHCPLLSVLKSNVIVFLSACLVELWLVTPLRDICMCLKEKWLRRTERCFSVCWCVFSLSFSQKLSLDLYYTEDEIYELSYTREPKNCKAPVSHHGRPLKWTLLCQTVSKGYFEIWGNDSREILKNCLKDFKWLWMEPA